MTEKDRVLNLVSIAMFHAEEMMRVALLHGEFKTLKAKEQVMLQKERYLHYAEQISEGLTHLRKMGLIN